MTDLNDDDATTRDLVAAFYQTFPGSTFGATSRVEERRRDERRAGMTPKQRRPKGRERTKTSQINFRCTPEFKDDLAEIADALDLSASNLIEEAVRELAKARGVKRKGVQDA